MESGQQVKDSLEEESKLRLVPKKEVPCPVTSISDPGGEEARGTGWMPQGDWVDAEPSLEQSQATVGSGTLRC